jgi:ABC-type polar amino acid transport system ATPase subunit
LNHSEYTPVRHFSGGHKRYGGVAPLKGISLPSVHVSHLRRRMGMVLQSFERFPHMTAFEDIWHNPF